MKPDGATRSPGAIGLLDRVRAACEKVAASGRHVALEAGRLASYADELAGLLRSDPPPEVDPASHHLGHGTETLAFFLLLDAVNFGSGFFPHLRKRAGRSGYFTVATSLKEHVESHGVPSPEALTSLDEAACAEIFGQDVSSEPVSELMRLFAAAWNDLGAWLLRRFDGRWEGPVEEAEGSAERLVGILSEMPFFQDVARYDGLEVPFYKRAQITAADLHHAFGGAGPGGFRDLDRLTIFADNLVPHVLRTDGVLRYAEPLSARIEAGEPLPAGAAEEVEIRACALHAVELLVPVVRAKEPGVNAMRLDYLLWNRGQGSRYKARPRHRTRTVYY